MPSSTSKINVTEQPIIDAPALTPASNNPDPDSAWEENISEAQSEITAPIHIAAAQIAAAETAEKEAEDLRRAMEHNRAINDQGVTTSYPGQPPADATPLPAHPPKRLLEQEDPNSPAPAPQLSLGQQSDQNKGQALIISMQLFREQNWSIHFGWEGADTGPEVCIVMNRFGGLIAKGTDIYAAIEAALKSINVTFSFD